jgi:hypothetical protein
MTTITYTILEGNLGECGLDSDQVKQFADAMETEISKAYPDATVNVVVKWATAGHSPDVQVHSGEEDDITINARHRILACIEDIAEQTLQKFGG